jgi:hypothetical protein
MQALDLCILVGGAGGSFREQLGESLLSLALPESDHVGMDVVFLGELGEGLVSDQGLKGHPGLEFS